MGPDAARGPMADGPIPQSAEVAWVELLNDCDWLTQAQASPRAGPELKSKLFIAMYIAYNDFLSELHRFRSSELPSEAAKPSDVSHSDG